MPNSQKFPDLSGIEIPDSNVPQTDEAPIPQDQWPDLSGREIKPPRPPRKMKNYYNDRGDLIAIMPDEEAFGVPNGEGVEDAIDRIAQKYNIDRNDLRKQALLYGYSPEDNKRDLEEWNKNPISNAAISTVGTLQKGAAFGLPMAVARAFMPEEHQKAITELYGEIDNKKSGWRTASDIAGEITLGANPITAPGRAIDALAETGNLSRWTKRGLSAASDIGTAAGIAAANAPAGDREKAAEEAIKIPSVIHGATAAGDVARQGLSKVKTPVMKLLSAFLGPSEETAQHYYTNRDRIVSPSGEVLTPTVSEIKSGIDEGTGKIKDAANGAIFDAENLRQQAHSEVGFARQKRELAAKEMQEALKQTKAPPDLPDRISESIKELGSQAVKGSQAAREPLIKSGKQYDANFLKGKIGYVLNKFKINGAFPEFGESGAAVKLLRNVYDNIERYGEQGPISANNLKSIIQDLDTISRQKFDPKMGQVGTEAAQAAGKVRDIFDSFLKKNEDYKKAMEPVARKTALASELNSRMPTSEAISNKIQSLGSQTSEGSSKSTLRLLKEIDAELGTNYSKEVDPILAARKLLADPKKLRELRMAIPENAKLQKAVDAERGAVAAVKAAKAEKSKSMRSMSKIGPSSSENVSKRKLSMEQEKQLQALGEKEGRDFVQEAQDRRVLDAFDKGSVNGSRRTTPLTSIIRSALGAAAGALAPGMEAAGAAVGGAAGFGTGLALDYYGPRLYRSILDFAKNNPNNIIGSFVPPLKNAAAKGMTSFAANHLWLYDRNKEYRDAILKMEEELDKQGKL